MWRPILKFLLNWLLNFILAFEVLMLRLKNHLTYHFYFEYAKRVLIAYSNLLYAYSNYFGNNISMNPLFLCPIWRIFLLLQKHHGGAKCCSMRIQNVSGVAQCSFKIWPELLYFIMQAHIATHPAFMMQVEQLPQYFWMRIAQITVGYAQSSSKHIQN